eukprot:GILJ01008206.1.p1 GENE.GILJ01008206.1~~GILJ01008206.1.p1  ORF type:complete len:698 (-),score=135.75 GILJ01008206.1:34-2127(-)
MADTVTMNPHETSGELNGTADGPHNDSHPVGSSDNGAKESALRMELLLIQQDMAHCFGSLLQSQKALDQQSLLMEAIAIQHQEEKQRWEQDLSESRMKIQTLQSREQQVTEVNQALESKVTESIQQLKTELTESEENRQIVTKKCEELKTKLQEMNQAHEQLNWEMEDLKRQLEISDRDKAKALRDCESLRAELFSLQDQIQGKETEGIDIRTALEQKNKSLEKQIEKLKETAEAEKIEFEQRLEEAVSSTKAAASQLSKASENKPTSPSHEEYQKTHGLVQAATEELTLINSRLLKEQTAHSDTREEVAMLQRRIKELEGALQELQTINRVLDVENRIAVEQLARIQAQMQLHRDLELIEGNVDVHTSKHVSIQQSNHAADAANRRHSRSLSTPSRTPLSSNNANTSPQLGHESIPSPALSVKSPHKVSSPGSRRHEQDENVPKRVHSRNSSMSSTGSFIAHENVLSSPSLHAQPSLASLHPSSVSTIHTLTARSKEPPPPHATPAVVGSSSKDLVVQPISRTHSYSEVGLDAATGRERFSSASSTVNRKSKSNSISSPLLHATKLNPIPFNPSTSTAGLFTSVAPPPHTRSATAHYTPVPAPAPTMKFDTRRTAATPQAGALELEHSVAEIKRSFEKNHMHLPIIKVSDSVYLLGKKKIHLRLLGGKPVVRMGGGFSDFLEFLEKTRLTNPDLFK